VEGEVMEVDYFEVAIEEGFEQRFIWGESVLFASGGLQYGRMSIL
jgi:hypothetical protein